MSSLINPTRPNAQAETDFNAEPVYLRNPETGMIFKLFHKDSITRCLREGYLPSGEQAMRAQAIELAELQGRPLPPWAAQAEAASAPVPDDTLSIHDLPPEVIPPSARTAVRPVTRK